MDDFFISWKFYGLYGLGAHDPYNVLPIMVDVGFFKHMTDCVYQLVGKDGKVNMGFNPLIVLMMDRPDV